MENRIKLELRGRKPEEVHELVLDNCRTPQVQGLTDEFVNLETLSLIHSGLTTLKGFPSLPHLRRLELSDNQIAGGLDVLAGCPELTHLIMSGNKIKDIETLKPLEKLKCLTSIELMSCDVSKIDDFRDKVFEAIPQIKYLDGFDRDGNEQERSEDEEDFVDEEITDEEDEDSEGDEEEGEEGAHEEEDEDSDDEEGAANGEGEHGKKRKHDEEDD